MKLWLVSILALLTSAFASAVPIDGLYNTGQPFALGAQDTNWTVLTDSQPAVVVNTGTGSWLTNTTDSKWISRTAGASSIGIHIYRITFTIDEDFDLATAWIEGRWATDDIGNFVRLNGVTIAQDALPAPPAGYTSWTLFSIASNFVHGVNTLDFSVGDSGGLGGLRVEFLDSNIELLPGEIPEPSTWILLSGGLIALVIRQRRAHHSR